MTWNNLVNLTRGSFYKTGGSGSRQAIKIDTQIVKASLYSDIVIARAALALTEWVIMILIRRIFISLEACDLACWVYVCKFIEGLSLEQIVDQNRSAEQFIAALFSMFDKYIDIPDNDSNNIRPS